MTACIVGWAHTKFGKLEGEDAESLIVRVAGDALHDAGVAPGDVDAIYMGFYNGGFSAQDFAASLALQADEHLRRSEEHTSELQSLMRISYAVFCLKKKTK